MPDYIPWRRGSFVVHRQGVSPGGTYVVIAEERDYTNGVSTLHGIVTQDERPVGWSPDRGYWSAQGIANVMGRHVFLSIENSEGITCVPIFPVDDGEFDFAVEEYGEVDRDYVGYIEDMKKEGRWQGEPTHVRYPWRK